MKDNREFKERIVEIDIVAIKLNGRHEEKENIFCVR